MVASDCLFFPHVNFHKFAEYTKHTSKTDITLAITAIACKAFYSFFIATPLFFYFFIIHLEKFFKQKKTVSNHNRLSNGFFVIILFQINGHQASPKPGTI